MNFRLFFGSVAVMSLAVLGCMQPAISPTAPSAIIMAVAGEGTVTATARLAVQDTEGRQVLAVVEPWKKANIDHVNVALFQGAATEPLVSQTVTQAQLSSTLTFANLKQNTSYRIVVTAWADAGKVTRIDNYDATSASCTTEFSTTTNDTVDAGAIKLTLKNKTFSGSTTGSTIAVTDGVLEATAATETITIVTPTPAPTPTPTPTPTATFDPCGVYPPPPGCPGYYDPCIPVPMPGCPGYVDPGLGIGI